MQMSSSHFWICEPDTLAQLQADFLAIDSKAAAFQSKLMPTVPLSYGPPGVAIVNVSGLLIRRAGPLCVMLRGTSTDQVAEAVARAEADDSIDTIIMRFETGGGQSVGLPEAAEVIRRAGQTKRTIGIAESLCASAGYWLAAQCNELYAEPSCQLGSIGTYTSLWDLSKAFEQKGVKVHTVTSGGVKGASEPGVAITDEYKAHLQEVVDSIQSDFKKAVQTGRGMSVAQVEAVADGRIFPSSDALSRGLIDGIRTFETIIQTLNEEVRTMSISATVPDLRAALPDADSDFILSCVEANMTLEQAKTTWAAVERMQSKNTTPPPNGNPGLDEPSFGSSRHDDDFCQDDAEGFMSKVDRYMADHDCSRAKAVAAIGRRYPQAHRAAVLGANDSSCTGVINQRFSMYR